jgi:hypothetical protein
MRCDAMRCVFDLREASSARIPTAPSSSIHGSIAPIGRYRDATGSDRISRREPTATAPAPVGEDVDTPDDIAPASASPAESRTRRDAARTRTAPRAEGRRVPNPRRPRWPLIVRARPSAAPAAATRRTTRRKSAWDTRTIGADQAAATPASASASAAFPPPPSRHPRRRKGGRPSSTAAASSLPPRPARPPAAIQVRCSSGSILRGLRSGNDRISDPPPVKIPYNIRPFESESIPPSLRDNNILGGVWGWGVGGDVRMIVAYSFISRPSVHPPPPRRSGTPPGTPGASGRRQGGGGLANRSSSPTKPDPFRRAMVEIFPR